MANIAQIYDAQSGNWKNIRIESLPAGSTQHLRCPEPGCHVPFGLVQGHMNEGCHRQYQSHFSANKGQSHIVGCDFAASAQQRMHIRMEEAVASEKQILIHLNFATIDEKYQPRVSEKPARETLPFLQGTSSHVWKQDHKGSYVSFSVNSLSGLSSIALAFRDQKYAQEGLHSHLFVSQSGHIIPWKSFYPSNQSASSRLHEDLIFTMIYNRMGTMPRCLFPSSIPNLKCDMSVRQLAITSQAAAKRLDPKRLHTHSERKIFLNDGRGIEHERNLRDVLQVPNENLRERLKAANSFTFVATPYLQTWSIVEGIKESHKPIYMFWSLIDDHQVIF